MPDERGYRGLSRQLFRGREPFGPRSYMLSISCIHGQIRLMHHLVNGSQGTWPFPGGDAALRRHNTEFGHMRPQGIDHLVPLPHQQIARAMLHQLTPAARPISPVQNAWPGFSPQRGECEKISFEDAQHIGPVENFHRVRNATFMSLYGCNNSTRGRKLRRNAVSRWLG